MKNKEITIYKLMGLIKDGKAPAKIKFRGEVYYWSYDTYTKNISTPDNQVSLFREYRIDYCLNQKIEILPEENDEWEDIPIFKVSDYKETFNQFQLDIFRQINLIKKNQKYLKERLDKNDCVFEQEKVSFKQYIDEKLEK